MKKICYLFLLLTFIISCKKIIPNNPNPPLPPPAPPVEDTDTTNLINYNKDITVVNWNIEWFGNGAMFNGDLNVQENNAGKILKYLNADLYGLCEIVDTARFGRMIRNNLGDEFRYKISFYPTRTGGQKYAFVYNRNIFRNVTVRPFMGLSSNANGNFAGRFPFLLTAEVTVNGVRNVVNYFLIHAKAYADVDSYAQRLKGSVEMKDSLDKYFSEKNIMIIGDYNDHLNGSITSGQLSPYKNFVDDGTHYNAISLPLNSFGNQSTISFPNSVIDNQIISTTMTKWFVNTSVKIRTDVVNVVPNYTTHNTSDHYPVSSVYKFDN
jgi:hypothetical protein